MRVWLCHQNPSNRDHSGKQCLPIELNATTVGHGFAEAGGLRAAADRPGVTRSAVSQTIRKL
jgi:hypothetical protein